MSFSAPRDVIQISLGSSANAVTAHALNLQGLAATDDGSDEGRATCDTQTTHYLSPQHHWVPRVLMVDEASRFFVSPQVSEQHAAFLKKDPTAVLGSAFAIQPLDPALALQAPQPNDWSQSFYQTSSTLAYSAHSRYYQEPESAGYHASAQNPRHVNWDDLDDEPEEDPRERQARLAREHNVWQRQTMLPLQDELTQMVIQAPFQKEETLADKAPSKDLHWMDFWMPPYSEKSKLALEYSHQSHLTPHWDSYHLGGSDNRAILDWQEDVLFDRLRHLLEECDACQGFVITTEGHGIYAGLTNSVLQEIQEEVKGASKMVFHITNPYGLQNDTTQDTTIKEDGSGWQPAHVQRLRDSLSKGLALYDFSQHADIVVPVELPSRKNQSLFRASAQLAMAMEACTLPIRLKNSSGHKDPRYDIGLLNAPFFGQGGGDSQWGTTAQRLSMSEYLLCLQPSKQYKVLELDALHSGNEAMTNQALWDTLKIGTSIERDARMRESGRDAPRFRPRDVAPGGWLQDSSHGGGMLSCLSPNPKASSSSYLDRSLHNTFALSTSMRNILQDDMSNYLTAMVQGMGIRYRPERSMSTVLNQTLGQLTRYGGYGAGAYWNALLNDDQPVVAVLGNSTRSYFYLDQVARDMKLVLGARYRGYYQRDVLNGVLPEAEDCNDALEGCWDLRDVYMPPDGSGLVDDDDGDVDF